MIFARSHSQLNSKHHYSLVSDNYRIATSVRNRPADVRRGKTFLARSVEPVKGADEQQHIRVRRFQDAFERCRILLVDGVVGVVLYRLIDLASHEENAPSGFDQA
jgi:hypothetical protein